MEAADFFRNRARNLELIRDGSKKGSEVEAAPTRDEHPLTAALGVRDSLLRHHQVLRDRVALARLHKVKAMVSHAGLFGRRGLGGADVHTAIHADGITGNNLGVVLLGPA